MTSCYEYNAFNQLAFRGRDCGRNTQAGITTRRVERIFIWDGDNIIAETDSTGTKRYAEFAYFPGTDRPFALVTDSSAGTGSLIRFYHQDELQNVIGLTRDSTVVQQIAYEPWGEVSAMSGSVADTSRLRWKGAFWEGGKTRLYYMRNRWYDPAARRFTSQDPIGLDGGLNQYSFAANEPISNRDPLGLKPCSDEQKKIGYEDVKTDDGDVECVKNGGAISGVVVVAVSASVDFAPLLRWLGGWGAAFRMTGEWAAGGGPAERVFGEGSQQVDDMRNAPGVNAARALACKKLAKGLAPEVTNFGAGFGLPGLFHAGLNSTRQFVGNYRVEIAPGPDQTMVFSLHNTTSMTSAGYRLLPSWERSTFAPGGNMRQLYTWRESTSECR